MGKHYKGITILDPFFNTINEFMVLEDVEYLLNEVIKIDRKQGTERAERYADIFNVRLTPMLKRSSDICCIMHRIERFYVIPTGMDNVYRICWDLYPKFRNKQFREKIYYAGSPLDLQLAMTSDVD